MHSEFIPLFRRFIVNIRFALIRIDAVFNFLAFTGENIRFHNGFVFPCRKSPNAVFIRICGYGIHIQISFIIALCVNRSILFVVDQRAVEIRRTTIFRPFFIAEPLSFIIPEKLIPVVLIIQIIKMIHAQVTVMQGNPFMYGFTGYGRIIVPSIRIGLPRFCAFVITHEVSKFRILRLNDIEVTTVIVIYNLMYFHCIVTTERRYFFRINNLTVLFNNNLSYAVFASIRNMKFVTVIFKRIIVVIAFRPEDHGMDR